MGLLIAAAITVAATAIAAVDLNPSGPGDEPIDLAAYTPPPLIAFDSATSASSGSGATSLTYSHTVNSLSNQVLVVGVESEDRTAADCAVSDVTYAGVSLTAIDSAATAGQNKVCVALWYRLAPPVGTADVVVTWNGNVNKRASGAINIYNVAQQAPAASAVQAHDAATSINTSVTTLTDSSLVVDAVGYGRNGAMTPGGAPQVQRYQSNSNSHGGAGGTEAVGLAASASLSWSATQSSAWAHVLAVFEWAG